MAVLFRIIREMKANGTTVIYISHRLDELYQVADRVTVMRDGCYVTTKDIGEVTKDQLISYMVGRELNKNFAQRSTQTSEVLLETRELGGNGVKPFSLTLHRGEVLGLGGLVGAGRSEYAQLIFGARPKDCGQVYLNGKPVEINSPEDAVEHGIGMVPEDRKLHGAILRMSIQGNIVVSILKKSPTGWALWTPGRSGKPLETRLRRCASKRRRRPSWWGTCPGQSAEGGAGQVAGQQLPGADFR